MLAKAKSIAHGVKECIGVQDYVCSMCTGIANFRTYNPPLELTIGHAEKKKTNLFYSKGFGLYSVPSTFPVVKDAIFTQKLINLG